MPSSDRELRYQDERPRLVAILADLPEVAAFILVKGAMAQSSTTRTAMRFNRVLKPLAHAFEPHGAGSYWTSLLFTFLGAAAFATVKAHKERIP